jgi:hypothetical protein
MMKVKKMITVYTVLFTAVLILFSGCGKNRTGGDAIVTFLFGDVKIKRKGNEQKVVLKEQLKKGDIILTGSGSFVVVQVGERAIFRIEQGSRVELRSITGGGESEFYLFKGLMLSKIRKLRKGEQYIIKTPTAVASVRGTVFLTEYNYQTTRVAVSGGKVKVEKVSSHEKKYADAGQTVFVTGSVKSRNISAIEKLTLEKIEDIPVRKIPSSLEKRKLEKEGEKIRENDRRIDKDISRILNKKFSLKNIRSEYGRIDVVTLYSGKIYRGAILSRGKRMRLITPSGIINIDGKKVRQTVSE